MDTHAIQAGDYKMLRFAMNLSLGVGVLMLLIKFGAYLLTGSAAIFADAIETVVHVVAVGFASYSLRLSQKPADVNHPYGHAKISFFSAGVEGSLIIIAALFIVHDAITKWMAGLVLENIGMGTLLTAVTIFINGGLGVYLVLLGRRKNSLILEANGKHVLTDAWTSLGVIVALGLIYLTGWLPWDPIFAIIVAGNILFSGFGLIQKSIRGLMDESDPEIQNQLKTLLDRETAKHGVTYHALRQRNLGDGHWVDFHLLFHDDISIRRAHTIATTIEKSVRDALPSRTIVTTHLEPLTDHARIHRH